MLEDGFQVCASKNLSFITQPKSILQLCLLTPSHSLACLLFFGFSLSQLPLVFLLPFHNPPENKSWAEPIHPRRLCAWRGCLCSEQWQGSVPGGCYDNGAAKRPPPFSPSVKGMDGGRGSSSWGAAGLGRDLRWPL